MTPVILLTDGFIANGSGPWKVKSLAELPSIQTRIFGADKKDYKPYQRIAGTMVREWAIPGTKGHEHRIGGLEKMAVTGTVSYVPENHEVMTHERDEKIKSIQDQIPELTVEGPDSGELLVIGWGSTYGHLITAVKDLQEDGKSVSLAHFNYINPLPKNTAEVLTKFKKILVCELNLGQFANYLRMNFPQFDYLKYNKVQGLPFTVVEIIENVTKILEGK